MAVLMLRASYWQYERYQWKLGLIATMTSHLKNEPAPILDVAQKFEADPESYVHRRVNVSGTFDFSHEMILRNRRLKDEPGVFVITPLKIDNSDLHILVNRGFIPISKEKPDVRATYQRPLKVSFLGLLKETVKPKFLGPADDPTGAGLPWVDSWIRINSEEMMKQLPYKVLPFYLEIMSIEGRSGMQLPTAEEVEGKIVSSVDGRAEMFMLPMNRHVGGETQFKDDELPIPVFDTVVPAGRHYGYIFEWAIMAAATSLITFGTQFRKPRRKLT